MMVDSHVVKIIVLDMQYCREGGEKGTRKRARAREGRESEGGEGGREGGREQGGREREGEEEKIS